MHSIKFDKAAALAIVVNNLRGEETGGYLIWGRVLVARHRPEASGKPRRFTPAGNEPVIQASGHIVRHD